MGEGTGRHCYSPVKNYKMVRYNFVQTMINSHHLLQTALIDISSHGFK